jgi:tRNA (guanine-N(7)-)-methyltransferase
MAWENQYIQLVSTKPGIIFGERENDLTEEARSQFRERVRRHSKIFVELGSGSGMHLLSLARSHPDALCAGFEIRFKRAFKTGEKAERHGLSNVAVMRADARQISTLFEPESVDGFFVNYPDPWDKRRWWKNRLVNEALVETMWSLLKSGGMFRYKTDHPEYLAYEQDYDQSRYEHVLRGEYSDRVRATLALSRETARIARDTKTRSTKIGPFRSDRIEDSRHLRRLTYGLNLSNRN